MSSLFPCVQSLSCVWLFATPRTVARQAPLSMGFPRQESWSGLPFPSPGDLPQIFQGSNPLLPEDLPPSLQPWLPMWTYIFSGPDWLFLPYIFPLSVSVHFKPSQMPPGTNKQVRQDSLNFSFWSKHWRESIWKGFGFFLPLDQKTTVN